MGWRVVKRKILKKITIFISITKHVSVLKPETPILYIDIKQKALPKKNNKLVDQCPMSYELEKGRGKSEVI